MATSRQHWSELPQGEAKRTALLGLTLRIGLPTIGAATLAYLVTAWHATRPAVSADQSLLTHALALTGWLLLLSAITCWIAIRAARPIAELMLAIERLGRGEQVRLEAGRAGALGRLQEGINDASQALQDARNRMHSELGRTTLALAEKNARLEATSQSRIRFLAAASHDLRQPLYALTLFSSALRAGEDDPIKLARVTRIEECVASLDQLFSELLDLSRLEAGVMRATITDVRLDDVFDEVSRNFRMLAESRDLRLVVRKTNATVRSDRTMLARILNNLVSNALRYTDEGGALIGVRHLRSGKVRIDVWDTGKGIAPAQQAQVFEEFYQVSPASSQEGERRRGLGLGLATVRRLAELVGCDVRLASRPGRGTCVSLLLDSTSDGHNVSSENIDLPLDISGLRVLVVDDDAGIREGHRALLATWGCDIRAASDESEAIEVCVQWEAPPDIVISDLHLQDDRTGLDALRTLALHYRQDPSHPSFARLLVTGETRPERIGEVAAAHIPVLFKPVSPEKMREAMLAAVLATTSPGSTASHLGAAP